MEFIVVPEKQCDSKRELFPLHISKLFIMQYTHCELVNNLRNKNVSKYLVDEASLSTKTEVQPVKLLDDINEMIYIHYIISEPVRTSHTQCQIHHGGEQKNMLCGHKNMLLHNTRDSRHDCR